MNTADSTGVRLVNAIKNKDIIKDYRTNHGNDYHDGYEELYLYKFKCYLGSVGRAIIEMDLNEDSYNGF